MDGPPGTPTCTTTCPLRGSCGQPAGSTTGRQPAKARQTGTTVDNAIQDLRKPQMDNIADKETRAKQMAAALSVPTKAVTTTLR